MPSSRADGGSSAIRGENMATVNTVLGPIDAADLGITLSHEHIATGSAGMHHTYPEFFDLEGTIEDAVIALTQA